MGVCWWRYKACVQKLVEKAKSNVETVIEDETENVEIEHTDYVTDTVEEELNSSVEYSYRERIDNGGNSVNCEQCHYHYHYYFILFFCKWKKSVRNVTA